MQVARQQHAAAGGGQRQEGRLQQARSPIDAKPAGLGSHRFRTAVLGFGHSALRLEGPPPAGEFRHIPGTGGLTQQLAHGRRQGTPRPVGRQMERQWRPLGEDGEERVAGPGVLAGSTHGANKNFLKSVQPTVDP